MYVCMSVWKRKQTIKRRQHQSKTIDNGTQGESSGDIGKKRSETMDEETKGKP